MSTLAGSRLGPYEIQSPLGAGGMGEVYRAKDTRLERFVAIKVLPQHLSSSAEVRRRFEREAKTISQLSHPHICALYDVGREGETEYLIMELLEGETLSDRLLRGPLPLEQTLRYGVEITDALDKAHRQGVVHRDLKPGNVMLTKTGVKLLDFGLAKAMTPPEVKSGLTSLPTVARVQNLTQEGTILGTFQYMAPEQLEGKETDSRTDIFALGCVLYEMATGRKAFSGTSQASLISAIMQSDPPSISTVQPMTPQVLDRVVRTCLAKDPEDRWQSAADVGRELKWITEGSLSSLAIPASRPIRIGRRERVAWLLAGISVLVAASQSLSALRRPHRSSPMMLVSSLPLPSTLQLAEWDRSVALSPDGSRLIIAGSEGATGVAQLWIRSLENPDVRPLAGTEGAASPFWAPDGKSIGFFASHKLKRMEIASSLISTICVAPDGRGGSWGPDGTIVLAPSVLGGLVRVSASGGTPVPVTKVSESQTDRLPFFLPDGKHVLFTRGSPVIKSGVAIYVLEMASGRVSTLMNEASEAMFAQPGYLLFRRGRTLMAQSFDAVSARLAGEPVVVRDGVNFYAPRWSGQFTVSDSGLLVYETEHVLPSSQLTWFDIDGNRISAVGGPSAIATRGLRISHDGKTAAVVVADSSSRSNIWLYDMQRGDAQRFSFEEGGEQPAWSPDDREIAYLRMGDGRIASRPVGGSGQSHELTEKFAELGQVSPDGTLLSIFMQGTAGSLALGVVPTRGKPQIRTVVDSHVSKANYVSPFSPNGQWVGYVSDESGRDELYLTPVSGSGGKSQVTSDGVVWATWPLRSNELFFIQPPDARLYAVEIGVGDGSIHVGTPRPLFGGKSLPFCTALDITSDGKRILVALPSGEGRSLSLVTNWMAGLRGTEAAK